MVYGSKIPKISINENLSEASKKITKYKLGMSVVMDNKIVKGILTDGDTRRSLRQNKKIENIRSHMNPNPLFVSDTSSASKALSIMNKKKITSLLVTSEKYINNKKRFSKLLGIVHIHSILQSGVK